MQAFMLYMSGGGVQIFSMGIVFMLMFSPFKNVAAINTGTWFLPAATHVLVTHQPTNTHSIRPIRTLFLQIVWRSTRPKDRLHPCKYVDTSVGAVQMQFDGSIADGNWGLVGV